VCYSESSLLVNRNDLFHDTSTASTNKITHAHETEQGTNIAAQERELEVGDGFTGEEVLVDAAHDHGRRHAVEEVVAELDHVQGVVVAVDALVVVIVHGGCLLLRI